MRLSLFRRIVHPAMLGACLLAAGQAGAARAQGTVPAANPDWPCFSPLRRHIDPALLWSGPLPAKGADWRKDAPIAALVAEIVPRDRNLAKAEVKLEAFIKGLPNAGRKARLTLLFAGLFQESARERARVIARIEALTARQRSLSLRIAKVSAEAGAVPQDNATADTVAGARQKLVFQRNLMIHIFKSMQATMRYACDVPPAIVARLAHFTQIIQAHMN